MTEAADSLAERIGQKLRSVDDFPAPGVRFLDIGPVIADAALLGAIVDALAAPFEGAGVTHVLGVEARGLYFAGAIATRLGAGLVPARKPGKLPGPVLQAHGAILDQAGVAGTAGLEPGQINTYRKPYEFEIAKGVVAPGARVLVVDDLLAKGGSLNACRKLVEEAGATLLGAAFMIELGALGGRDNAAGLAVHAIAVL